MMIDLSDSGSTYSTRFPVRVSSRPLWRNYRWLVAFDLVRLEGEDQRLRPLEVRRAGSPAARRWRQHNLPPAFPLRVFS
jgi:hypothetical protein